MKKHLDVNFTPVKEAENDALCRKPDPGVDYDVKDGEPEMKITYELRVPPEDTELMNLVLVEMHGQKYSGRK